MQLVALSGSLRADSYNTQLCEAMKVLAEKNDVTVTVVTLHDIPLYNQDIESPVPEPVAQFKHILESADGIIIATPEYNNMIPGVLKNALEWASGGNGGTSVLVGKPVAITGASTGGFGTVRAQNQLLLLCSLLKMRTSGTHRFPVSKAQNVFTDGVLSDQDMAKKLEDFLNNCIAWMTG